MAHRRVVGHLSVLESLRANLATITLTTVLEEVGRWMTEGISLFARQWQALQAKLEAEANTGQKLSLLPTACFRECPILISDSLPNERGPLHPAQLLL
jgi:hypothetical protein